MEDKKPLVIYDESGPVSKALYEVQRNTDKVEELKKDLISKIENGEAFSIEILVLCFPPKRNCKHCYGRGTDGIQRSKDQNNNQFISKTICRCVQKQIEPHQRIFHDKQMIAYNEAVRRKKERAEKTKAALAAAEPTINADPDGKTEPGIPG